ncbi:cytochrome P450 4V3 [Biscogniauxia mediterranea]|nr:cytochrome P450 4V3 [Biscogniauxia mediterranea]
MAFDNVDIGSLLWRSVAVVLAVVVGRFLYGGYVSRSRVRALKAQGLPILPHSLLFGHLPILAEFRAAHPPDANMYLVQGWLARNWKKYLPDQDDLPPVVYLDTWPVSASLAVIFDPLVAAQFTYTKNLPKSDLTIDFLKPLTGGIDIVCSEGEAWKTWRSRFNPGFSQRNLTALLPDLLEEATVFADGLKKSAGRNGQWGPVFPLEERTTNLTLDIITRSALDMRLNEQTATTSSPLKVALMDQLRLLGTRTSVKNWLPTGYLSWRAAINRNNKVIRDVLMPLIQDKLQSDSSNASQKKTTVDLAIRYVDKDDRTSASSRQAPSPEFIDHLIANLKVFLFAGHDTTSSTICFMTKLLADHPDCLAKMRAEHDAVLGPDPDRAAEALLASPHLLHALPYTLGVIKETLRLYPLAATARATPPGTRLLGAGGRCYPVDGFELWAAPPVIQTHPGYWGPRAHEFAPERWTAAEGEGEPRCCKEAWIPFAYGPRNCIGMELALTELKLVAVLTARSLDVEEAWEDWDAQQQRGSEATTTTTTPAYVVDGQRLYPVGMSTVHPKDGMPVHVRLRDRPAVVVA